MVTETAIAAKDAAIENVDVMVEETDGKKDEKSAERKEERNAEKRDVRTDGKREETVIALVMIVVEQIFPFTDVGRDVKRNVKDVTDAVRPVAVKTNRQL